MPSRTQRWMARAVSSGVRSVTSNRLTGGVVLPAFRRSQRLKSTED